MKIVISQPMFFPWIGLFEQISLADLYVHYDDVQFSKGSFVNRVQIKTQDGFKWMTVPLDDLKLGQHIKDVKISDKTNWRASHLDLLRQVYAKAPYQQDMLDIVSHVYSHTSQTISELSISSISEICKYFSINDPTDFLYSSKLGLPGTSSQRVLDVVKHLHGKTYITGHGARQYLDHDLFEQNNIRVEYINYNKHVYPQLYGEFTPYVSILDLVANMGKSGRDTIDSQTIHWKEFIK